MNGGFTEGEWQCFQSCRQRMLEEFAKRQNQEAAKILQSAHLSHSDRLLKLAEHARKADRLLTDCFDDWRLASFQVIATEMARQKLIPDELWKELSKPTRDRIELLQKR